MLLEPVESEAMSGLSGSMPPRSRPLPERPPVESWMIMPGQCFLSPSTSRPKRSGPDVVVPSSFRTWQCASDAPASSEACVDSTCSATVIGTAGLSFLVGTDPVIATVMMQGVVMPFPPAGLVFRLEPLDGADLMSRRGDARNRGGGRRQRYHHVKSVGVHEGLGVAGDGDVTLPEHQITAREIADLDLASERLLLHVAVARACEAGRMQRQLHQPGAVDAER